MEYKGYTIDHDFYKFMSGDKVTVFCEGEDFIFDTEQEAKDFIDEITA